MPFPWPTAGARREGERGKRPPSPHPGLATFSHPPECTGREKGERRKTKKRDELLWGRDRLDMSL